MEGRLNVVIKVSNTCNLHCRHCYEGTPSEAKPVFMSEGTLEKIVRIIQRRYRFVKYSWFGGEPLTVGVEFFKKAVALQNKYNQGNSVSNSIQTNGTLLNPRWINFIRENNFNLSISYDAQFNNVLRQQTELVEKNLRLLLENNESFNVLSTVHSQNYQHLIEMYDFLKEFRCGMKFNPIFPSGNAAINSEYLINSELYAKELDKFFRYWLSDEKAAPVSNFIQYVKLFLNLPGRPCIYSGCLYKMLEIESNGDVRPCSRYSDNSCVILNINECAEVQEIFEHDQYKKLAAQAVERRLHCKNNCEVYKYCLGGCTSAAFNEVGVKNNSFQLCRITRAAFPLIFSALKEKLENTQSIKNPILTGLLSKVQRNYQ